MKDSYYFPHDSNARNDPKLALLRAKLGWAGYGLYWAIIEFLRDQPTYCLPIGYLDGLEFSIGYDHSDPQIEVGFDEFMALLIKLDLIQKGDEFISCRSLSDRMQPLEHKRLMGKISADKRWGNANPMPTQCQPNASKVKESKVKHINRAFVKPSVEEIRSYCIERKNNVNPNLFFDSYESKGWMVGKNKMKDWKACVRTWENNNFQRSVKKEEPKKTIVRYVNERPEGIPHSHPELSKMIHETAKKLGSEK